MYFRGSFESDWVQLFEFAVLERELHKARMAGRKYRCCDSVSRFEVVSSRVVKVVVERLQAIHVGRCPHFAAQPRKLNQHRTLVLAQSSLYLQAQLQSVQRCFCPLYAFEAGQLMQSHDWEVVNFGPDAETKYVIKLERLVRQKQRYLIGECEFYAAVVEQSLEQIAVGVVLRVSNLKLVLLLNFVADYAPERCEIFAHAEDEVEKVTSVLARVLFFMLFELLQPDPSHTRVDSAIECLGDQGGNSWLFAELLVYELCLVLAVE